MAEGCGGEPEALGGLRGWSIEDRQAGGDAFLPELRYRRQQWCTEDRSRLRGFTEGAAAQGEEVGSDDAERSADDQAEQGIARRAGLEGRRCRGCG